MKKLIKQNIEHLLEQADNPKFVIGYILSKSDLYYDSKEKCLYGEYNEKREESVVLMLLTEERYDGYEFVSISDEKFKRLKTERKKILKSYKWMGEDIDLDSLN